MDRAGDIYPHVPGKWQKSEKRWVFPGMGGASIRFRHLDRDDDARHYQGKNMTYCGIDEMPQFATPAAPDMLWGAMRSAHNVPVLFRATGNPGGAGHEWIQERYIDPAEPMQVQHVKLPIGTHRRVFIPSYITDNRALLESDPEYLSRLHLVGAPWLVEAWLRGDWNARPKGVFFDTLALNYGDPPHLNSYYLGVDPATRDADAQDREWKHRDPTALVVVGVDYMHRPWIVDVLCKQMDTHQWFQEVIRLNRKYKFRKIWLEGGAIWRAAEPWIRKQMRERHIFLPLDICQPGSAGDKATRATPFQSILNAGGVWVPKDNTPWLDKFLRELSIFDPIKSKRNEIFDDQVDAVSWIFYKMQELQTSARSADEMPDALAKRRDLERVGRSVVENGMLSGAAAERILAAMERHQRYDR